MKIFTLLLFLLSSLNSVCQTSEKKDFFLNVLANPTFSLCDFKHIGLNEHNTKLETEEVYLNKRYSSKNLNKWLNKTFGNCEKKTVHTAYIKIKNAWEAYKKVQYRDECIHVKYSRENIWAKPMDPSVKSILSTIPLETKGTD